MEPQRLECDFGPEITLWGGGADTRAMLPRTTPDEYP